LHRAERLTSLGQQSCHRGTDQGIEPFGFGDGPSVTESHSYDRIMQIGHRFEFSPELIRQ
jgi:hypothetical protein